MADHVAIVSVEQTGPIAKTDDGKGFRAPIRYTLEDGQIIETGTTCTRKKEVVPQIEHMNAKAHSGELSASFMDGKFFGTQTSYYIGPPRETI